MKMDMLMNDVNVVHGRKILKSEYEQVQPPPGRSGGLCPCPSRGHLDSKKHSQS